MSTPVTPASALDQRRYQSGIILQTLLGVPLHEFTGKPESNAAFWVYDEPGQSKGSSFYRRFSKWDRDEQPQVAPVVGAEGGVDKYTDIVALDYACYTGFIENEKFEQGLVDHDLRAPELTRLSQNWITTHERSVINQLAGNTLVNTVPRYAWSGMNIVTAQDANHIYYTPDSSGANTTEAQVAADSTATLDGEVLEDLFVRMSSREYGTEPIAPCTTPFGELYVLVCSPIGMQQLQRNATGNDIFSVQKAMIEGGMDLMDTPLGNCGGFIYRNFLCIPSNYMPQGITSGSAQANTKVAIAFGANAGAWIYGGGWAQADNHVGYTEHVVHRRLSMNADSTYGFKRTIVNDTSWASFRVVHYSPV